MCIGCKLANGELPIFKVYEDNDLTVIMDLYPYSKGHMFILTKEHYENVVDLPKELSHQIMDLTQKLVSAVNSVFNPESVIIMQNNGAMNSLSHYHNHVVPHYSDSDINTLYDTTTFERNDESYLSDLRDQIKAKLI